MNDDFICQVCGCEDQDIRTLTLNSFYNFSEVSSKFIFEGDCYYGLKACKSCRGDFISMLHSWVNGDFLPDPNEIGHLDPERKFPVRIDGRIMMMTEEELGAHKNLGDDTEKT